MTLKPPVTLMALAQSIAVPVKTLALLLALLKALLAPLTLMRVL